MKRSHPAAVCPSGTRGGKTQTHAASQVQSSVSTSQSTGSHNQCKKSTSHFSTHTTLHKTNSTFTTGPSSQLQIPSILLIIALCILVFSVNPTSALGVWPHNLSSTWGWIGYIALTSIAFFVPLLFCLCCVFSMSGCWLVRKHLMDEGRYLKKQIYMCLVPFSVCYLVLIFVSLGLALVYILTTASFMSVKDIGFTMGNHLITVPKSLNSSINDIFYTFEEGLTSGREYQSNLERIDVELETAYSYIREARVLISDRSDDVMSMINTVDSIDTKLANMTDSYSFSTSFHREDYDLGTLGNYTTMLNDDSSLDAAFSAASSARTQLEAQIASHTFAMNSYESDLDSRFRPARNGAYTMLNSLSDFLSTYVTDLIANYDLFSVLIAIVLAIIIVSYLVLTPLLCSGNYYAVFKMNHKMLKNYLCCSCFSAGFFLFAFSCFLCAYSFVYDACEEVEKFSSKVETISEAEAFKNGFSKIPISIDLSAMVDKLQTCDTEFTYIEAAGLSDPTKWSIDSTMEALNANISSTLNSVDVSLFENTQSHLANYSNSFYTPEQSVITTSAALSTNLKAFYDNFMKSTYNYNVTDVLTAKSTINAITASVGYTFSYANIDQLNTSAVPFSTNLTSTQLATLDQWKPILVSERELISEYPNVAGLVENFDDIRSLLTSLQSYAASVDNFLRSYIRANSTASHAGSWVETYSTTVSEAASLSSTIRQQAYYAVGNSSTLSCAPIGTFFSQSRQVMCQQFNNLTLMTALLSAGVGIVFVCMYCILLSTHYRVEFLSELPYKMKTVKPFQKRSKFSMASFGGVQHEQHVELKDML